MFTHLLFYFIKQTMPISCLRYLVTEGHNYMQLEHFEILALTLSQKKEHNTQGSKLPDLSTTVLHSTYETDPRSFRLSCNRWRHQY